MARSSALLLGLLASCYSAPAQPSLAPATIIVASEPATDAVPSTGTLVLDENTAIAYALEHSPKLTERIDAERVADAEIGAARQLTNPELRIGRSSEDGVLGLESKFGVGLRIHPDAPWTVSARVAHARAERDAERAETATLKRTVIAEIREIYADLAYGESMQAMLDHQLEVLRERNRVMAERMQRATSTKLENLLADHDLADLESKKGEVELELAQAHSKLARLVGVPAGQVWRAVADRARLLQVRTGLDVRALTERAIAAHPEIALATARADAAGADAYVEKTKRLPSLEWIQIERSTKTEVEWSVGASVAVPLFSLNSGNIAVAAAEQRRFMNDRERVAQTAIHQVREAVRIVESTGKHARELADRLAPLNEQIDKLLEQELTTATADPLKVLLLEERHARAQRDLLQANYEHRRALIELELVVGIEP